MTSYLAYKRKIGLDYNPNQPRDDDGKFTESSKNAGIEQAHRLNKSEHRNMGKAFVNNSQKIGRVEKMQNYALELNKMGLELLKPTYPDYTNPRHLHATSTYFPIKGSTHVLRLNDEPEGQHPVQTEGNYIDISPHTYPNPSKAMEIIVSQLKGE